MKNSESQSHSYGEKEIEVVFLLTVSLAIPASPREKPLFQNITFIPKTVDLNPHLTK